MERAGTEVPDSLLMLFRSVPFVFVKTVLRIKGGGIFAHPPVPCDLGEDRGAGDAEGQHIAVLDAGLRDRHVVQPDVIDQQMVRPDPKPRERPFHGVFRGVQDPDPVDLPVVSLPDRPGRGGPGDPAEHGFPFRGGHQLAVADAVEDVKHRRIGGKDHRAGHDRPCPASPPGLIDPRDTQKTLRPEGLFIFQRRFDFHCEISFGKNRRRLRAFNGLIFCISSGSRGSGG